MSNQTKLITRRQLLGRGLALGAVTAAAWTTGCGGKKKEELSCNDTSGLAASDVTLRNTLKYTDKSPEPNKQCNGCQLFVAPAQPASCGGCQLFKGPVHPNGYCTSWVQKAS